MPKEEAVKLLYNSFILINQRVGPKKEVVYFSDRATTKLTIQRYLTVFCCKCNLPKKVLTNYYFKHGHSTLNWKETMYIAQ